MEKWLNTKSKSASSAGRVAVEIAVAENQLTLTLSITCEHSRWCGLWSILWLGGAWNGGLRVVVLRERVVAIHAGPFFSALVKSAATI